MKKARKNDVPKLTDLQSSFAKLRDSGFPLVPAVQLVRDEAVYLVLDSSIDDGLLDATQRIGGEFAEWRAGRGQDDWGAFL